MAQQEVQFEIFTRRGAKGGWKLHDVLSNRDGAIKLAQTMMASGEVTGVKVVKETYNSDTGDYLTLKIFEDGHNKATVDPAAEDVPNILPCFKPDDLYSYHARATMTRLLGEYLARNTLTVTELIHRADALEQFEATGTTYQHAIQKVAIAQASAKKRPVQHIIRDLNSLVSKAIARVYRDARRNYFPAVEDEDFRALADRLTGESDGGYILNGAIARHLRSATGWEGKVVRLLAIMEQGKDDSPGARLLLSSVDAIVSEILNGSAALHELIGDHENLGDALTTLIHLFLGQARSDKPASSGIAVLTRHFAADDLPASRTAIANRIMAELKSPRSLGGETLLDEIAIMRRIANKLVLGQGKYLSHDDLIAAFTTRSRRLVTYEGLARFVEPISGPDDKIEQLLMVEEGIIGAENKRQLATVILPFIGAARFTDHFQDASIPVLVRLQRLADLQGRVLRSGLQENQRHEIAQALDKVAAATEARARILESIAGRSTNPVDKVVTVLKLCSSGVLTEGHLSAKARAMVLADLNKPGFFADYIDHLAHGAKAPAPETAKAELIQILEKAGITSETGLKAFAA